jgi:hypothetical protein
MLLELLGVFYNREKEINGLTESKTLLFSLLKAIQKIKTSQNHSIKQNIFGDVERDHIAWEMINLKFSTKKMDQNKLISLEEEFFELDEANGGLKSVRATLVKKIADPELDLVIFRLTFINLVAPLVITIVVALLPTHPVI